jgi:hypothetical protein
MIVWTQNEIPISGVFEFTKPVIVAKGLPEGRPEASAKICTRVSVEPVLTDRKSVV